jgi:hypothetical protein
VKHAVSRIGIFGFVEIDHVDDSLGVFDLLFCGDAGAFQGPLPFGRKALYLQ